MYESTFIFILNSSNINFLRGYNFISMEHTIWITGILHFPDLLFYLKFSSRRVTLFSKDKKRKSCNETRSSYDQKCSDVPATSSTTNRGFAKIVDENFAKWYLKMLETRNNCSGEKTAARSKTRLSFFDSKQYCEILAHYGINFQTVHKSVLFM